MAFFIFETNRYQRYLPGRLGFLLGNYVLSHSIKFFSGYLTLRESHLQDIQRILFFGGSAAPVGKIFNSEEYERTDEEEGYNPHKQTSAEETPPEPVMPIPVGITVATAAPSGKEGNGK